MHGEVQKSVLDKIKTVPDATGAELASMLGVPTKTIFNSLYLLAKKDAVHKIGKRDGLTIYSATADAGATQKTSKKKTSKKTKRSSEIMNDEEFLQAFDMIMYEIRRRITGHELLKSKIRKIVGGES